MSRTIFYLKYAIKMQKRNFGAKKFKFQSAMIKSIFRDNIWNFSEEQVDAR